MSVLDRVKHAWNAFNNKDPTYDWRPMGPSYSMRPDRMTFSRGNERSIITSVYNRIAIDAAAIDMLHVRLDEDGRFIDIIDSDLNNCLTVEANLDQAGRAFRHDLVASLLDEGCVAIVPILAETDPEDHESVKIYSMRVGRITQWYPAHVQVEVYNEQTGRKEEVKFRKDTVAIIENPFYAVMNEPNSTLQRLIRKLNLLDAIDEQSGSGKLDLIIQLPYVIKSEARAQQAEHRRQQIEEQLAGSKYGIAYTDGTERVTQLNRPVENNLMNQIEFLTSMLYSQLGLTQGIMDGSADEQTMTNYYNRTIEPILTAIVEEIKRKFLSRTARSQKQSIQFFRDPLRLVPVTQLAEITDKFTRNCVATSNEIRQKIGWKPADDPNADKLVNNNLRDLTQMQQNQNEETKQDEE